MYTLIEVKNKKLQKDFLDFPLKLYKGNKYFVPPIYMDEKKIFNQEFGYNKFCQSKFFLVYEERTVVGRIQVIYHPVSDKKWSQKRARFTRFDAIDDQKVANMLFDVAISFAKSFSLNEIVGPLGYSDLDREGLLIEGFDYLNTYEEQYNYPYYQKLIENYGFVKDVDWVESRLFPIKEFDTHRYSLLVERILKRYNLKMLKTYTTRKLLKKYSNHLFDLVDESYSNLYMTVPILPEQRKDILKNFKLIINRKYFRVIVDTENNPVAFGVCFPSISKALQKSSGHLTLPCIFKLIKAIKKPESLDLGLVGVSKKYPLEGIGGVIFLDIINFLATGKVKYYETNLNLEDNIEIQKNWSKFDSIQHKRRRCFVKKI